MRKIRRLNLAKTGRLQTCRIFDSPIKTTVSATCAERGEFDPSTAAAAFLGDALDTMKDRQLRPNRALGIRLMLNSIDPGAANAPSKPATQCSTAAPFWLFGCAGVNTIARSRWSWFASIVLSGWTQASAQVPGEGDVKKDAWVISYAVVIVCIALGVFIISKPARREK